VGLTPTPTFEDMAKSAIISLERRVEESTRRSNFTELKEKKNWMRSPGGWGCSDDISGDVEEEGSNDLCRDLSSSKERFIGASEEEEEEELEDESPPKKKLEKDLLLSFFFTFTESKYFSNSKLNSASAIVLQAMMTLRRAKKRSAFFCDFSVCVASAPPRAASEASLNRE